jgi:hypothetical protein
MEPSALNVADDTLAAGFPNCGVFDWRHARNRRPPGLVLLPRECKAEPISLRVGEFLVSVS